MDTRCNFEWRSFCFHKFFNVFFNFSYFYLYSFCVLDVRDFFKNQLELLSKVQRGFGNCLLAVVHMIELNDLNGEKY